MVFIDKTTTHSSESRNRLELWKNEFIQDGKTLDDLYKEDYQTGYCTVLFF